MMTVICITVLICLMRGRNAGELIEKIKDTDWNKMYDDLKVRLRPFCIKYGSMTSRPLLQFYYVMQDENTTVMEKAMIYGAIIYVISPVSLLPRAVYGLIGMTDEAAAMVFVYKKIRKKITPAVNARVEDTLREWFGDEYEIIGI